MRTVAVYNMKGGVGKTTTAVNLSYLAAASGQRTLLWDLDPQASSSFALRVQPSVSGLRQEEPSRTAGHWPRPSRERIITSSICSRPTSRIANLNDSSTRLGKPERLIGSLLDRLGRDYESSCFSTARQASRS